MILNSEEAIAYIGGGKITASLLSAANALFKSIYEMGQNLGSTIKRWLTKSSC